MPLMPEEYEYALLDIQRSRIDVQLWAQVMLSEHVGIKQ
jgi:hypothetical protein